MNKDLNYFMKLPYKVEITYEPADNTWIASCPELGKGTCYAIGKTQIEALEMLEIEKRDLFEFLLNEKKEIPELEKSLSKWMK